MLIHFLGERSGLPSPSGYLSASAREAGGMLARAAKVLTFYSYKKVVIKYWETIVVQNEN